MYQFVEGLCLLHCTTAGVNCTTDVNCTTGVTVPLKTLYHWYQCTTSDTVSLVSLYQLEWASVTDWDCEGGSGRTAGSRYFGAAWYRLGGGQLLGEAWKGVRGRCMDPPLLLLPHSLQLLNHPIRLTASILKD